MSKKTHWKLGSRQQSALECSGIADGILDEELEVIAKYWDPQHPDLLRIPERVDCEELYWAFVEVSNHNDRIAEESINDRDRRTFHRQDSTAFSSLAEKVLRRQMYGK